MIKYKCKMMRWNKKDDRNLRRMAKNSEKIRLRAPKTQRH
jgi:hypothetical protein